MKRYNKEMNRVWNSTVTILECINDSLFIDRFCYIQRDLADNLLIECEDEVRRVLLSRGLSVGEVISHKKVNKLHKYLALSHMFFYADDFYGFNGRKISKWYKKKFDDLLEELTK